MYGTTVICIPRHRARPETTMSGRRHTEDTAPMKRPLAKCKKNKRYIRERYCRSTEAQPHPNLHQLLPSQNCCPFLLLELQYYISITDTYNRSYQHILILIIEVINNKYCIKNYPGYLDIEDQSFGTFHTPWMRTLESMFLTFITRTDSNKYNAILREMFGHQER